MAEPASLRVRALRMLARREYSRLELQKRLMSDGAGDAEVESVLDEFERNGWLSERRLVDAVVRMRRQRFGAARVLRELKDKGVSEEGLTQAQAALNEDEIEAARRVWSKKFGTKPSSLAERARQTRFLAGRGFSQEVIRKVLDLADD